MKGLAQTLRRNQTDAEQMIWAQLRNRQVLNCKFRRQQIVGSYIADFLCIEPKLIIEIDGGHHSIQSDADEIRSQYLRKLGYQVLRFWNNDALQESFAVMESIRLAIIDLTPSPQPSPGGRGG